MNLECRSINIEIAQWLKKIQKFTSIHTLSLKIILVFVLLAGIGDANAATVIVNQSGTADYMSIQGAIDGSTVDGDTILVHNGKYDENVDFRYKKLTVIGVNFDGSGQPTVDGHGGVVFTVPSSNRGSIIEGFNLLNGTQGVYREYSRS